MPRYHLILVLGLPGLPLRTKSRCPAAHSCQRRNATLPDAAPSQPFQRRSSAVPGPDPMVGTWAPASRGRPEPPTVATGSTRENVMQAHAIRYHRGVALGAAALGAAAAIGLAGLAQAGPGGPHSHGHALVKPPPGSTGSNGPGSGQIMADPPTSSDSGGPGSGQVLASRPRPPLAVARAISSPILPPPLTARPWAPRLPGRDGAPPRTVWGGLAASAPRAGFWAAGRAADMMGRTHALSGLVTGVAACPILAGERHLRDPGHIHPLRRQQHHLRPPPGHHRPTVPAHDPHQSAALIIIDLTHPHTSGHRPSLEDQHSPGQRQPAGQT